MGNTMLKVMARRNRPSAEAQFKNKEIERLATPLRELSDEHKALTLKIGQLDGLLRHGLVNVEKAERQLAALKEWRKSVDEAFHRGLRSIRAKHWWLQREIIDFINHH